MSEISAAICCLAGVFFDASAAIERRARASVGVDCPSFGGQRTVGGGAGFPAAGVLSRPQPAIQGKALRCLRLASALVVEGGSGPVLPLGQVGLTETAEIRSLSRQSRAAFTLSVESGLSRPSRKGRSAKGGAAPVPNPSVKGTSCGRPQAAPYLER